MLNQFSRTELLYGKAALENLAAMKIAVFGLGGVGGYTVEALARAGIGRLDIIDDDKVCLTNINRQIYALRTTIGRYKVDVAKERIAQINPDCKVNAKKIFYTPQTASEFDFSQYDYIVDAIDTVTAKIDLAVQAQINNTPIISAMGAGNKKNPLLFEVSDIYDTSVCPLAKVMRKELKKRQVKKLKVVYSKEKPVVPIENTDNSCKMHCICPPGTIRKCTQKRQIPSSNSFIPPIVGFIIAGEIINELVNKNF
ncbi:ThiF family adenylyltransferase [Pectinatus frisingensis]|jgi:tRNA A37 threonylcarbamoyladenosine dehydratase|uniref:tRNA threonylcarbamoyladenosine dehydratase n=1 Tax=Pectinatus frisingensis TaxID=865 RepID=UPI0018C55820|nr:tRNA threonylcarbamoyladenosine dehydratase [Pectinatus frisingensis]